MSSSTDKTKPEEGLVSIREALAEIQIGTECSKISSRELSGGLTNDNVLVTLKCEQSVNTETERKLVMRRFQATISRFLGYNRAQEFENTCIAHLQKNVGAPVLGFVPPRKDHGGSIVLEFVEAIAMDENAMHTLCSSAQGRLRLVDSLKRLHKSPAIFPNTFDPYRARRFYEEQVFLLSGKKVAWEGYDELVQKLMVVQEHLALCKEDLVDCHNDLLSANFLDSSPDITILDWELSGRAEPSWELGNFISENGLDDHPSIIHSIIESYWADLPDVSISAKIKRVKLYSIVSKVTWAAWGAVLHHLHRINSRNFDYREWSMERIRKAKRALSDQSYIDRLCC